MHQEYRTKNSVETNKEKKNKKDINLIIFEIVWQKIAYFEIMTISTLGDL